MPKLALSFLFPLMLTVCATAQRPKSAPQPTPEVQKLLDAAEKLPAKVRMPTLEDALDLAVRLRDRVGEGLARNARGECRYELDQPEEAVEEFQAALPIEREVKDRLHEAMTLSNTGTVYDDLGQKDDALAKFTEALRIQRAIHDRDGEATTLDAFGKTYRSLGQSTKGGCPAFSCNLE
jgi:tetratricopeptide (TPR) repeat protein